MLIVISGLPGIGKTALASALARRLAGVHLSVDIVEDALLGAGLERGWTTGVAAYEAVRAAAEQNLSLGLNVVVDAVNDSDGARQTWRDAAAATHDVLRFVLLAPPAPVEHRRRLRDRRRALQYVHEPTWEEVCQRAQTYEEWSDDRIELSANDPVEQLVVQIQEALNVAR